MTEIDCLSYQSTDCKVSNNNGAVCLLTPRIIADITESFEKLSPSPKKKKAKSEKVGAVFCQGG